MPKAPTQDEVIEFRLREVYSAPFRPATSRQGPNAPDARSAHAMEYIAAQLGMIRNELELARLSKTHGAGVKP